MSKTILKENKNGRLTLPDFETQYKATFIKTTWFWGKDGKPGQWNRRESLETENKHLVVSKAETIRWGKEGLFINDTGAGGYPNERQ